MLEPEPKTAPPLSLPSGSATYRRLLTLALSITLCLACTADKPGNDASNSLNVVLITLDTTRADYLSSYGYAEITTPNLDRLAARGTRFEHAIATASVTPVSHAAILTGLDNHRHGLRVLSAAGGFRLDPEVPTLATLLQQRGYSTVAVHSAFPVSAHFGLDQGFDIFDSFDATISVTEGERVKHSWSQNQFQRRSDETTDLLLEHLQGLDEPFLLWVHYWDPHDKGRLPPKEFLPDPVETSGSEDDDHPDAVEKRKRLYAAEIRYMDSQIGRLFDTLDERGLADTTMIFVVADHGQGLGDHHWNFHRLLYREQIQVPLIATIPGHRQVPLVDALVRTVDIVPTVLDYLGIDADIRASGSSLRGLIEGETEPPRLAIADQINGFDLNASMVEKRPLDDFLYSAIDLRWKLIYRPTHPDRSELFDLDQDPDERVNLFGQRPEQELRLLQELARRRPWVLEPFAPDEAADDLEAAQAALTALGYLGGSDTAVTELDWEWFCPERRDERHESPRDVECATPLVPVLAGR
ncbi:MAG: sulfatase [Acidobacteriota bacterium]